jgi:hypothetical protein
VLLIDCSAMKDHRYIRWWAIRVTAVAILIGIPLAGFEILVEYLLRNPAALRFMPEPVSVAVTRIYNHRDRIQINMDPKCSRFDEQVLYTLRPGQCRFTNREFDTHFRINSAGLRDEEEALVAPDVIFLGDSYTMGWGVEQDEAFPQRVARATGLKTLNTGITSYGTVRETLVFEKLDRSNLKFVVLQYGENDYAENEFFARHGKLRPGDKKRFDRLARKAARNTRYFPFKYIYSVLRISLGTILQSAPPPTPNQEVDALMPLLRRIAQAAGNVPVLVFDYRPSRNRHQRFNDALAARLAGDSTLGRSIKIIDVAADLKADETFILDDHWTVRGHAVVAAGLARHIANPPSSQGTR